MSLCFCVGVCLCACVVVFRLVLRVWELLMHKFQSKSSPEVQEWNSYYRRANRLPHLHQPRLPPSQSVDAIESAVESLAHEEEQNSPAMTPKTCDCGLTLAPSPSIDAELCAVASAGASVACPAAQ